jgi:hypothetical protein
MDTRKNQPAAPTAPTVATVMEQMAALRERAAMWDAAATMLTTGLMGTEKTAPTFFIQPKGGVPRWANWHYVVQTACDLHDVAKVMKAEAAALAATPVGTTPAIAAPSPSTSAAGDRPVQPDSVAMENNAFELVEVASLKRSRPRTAKRARR